MLNISNDHPAISLEKILQELCFSDTNIPVLGAQKKHLFDGKGG